MAESSAPTAPATLVVSDPTTQAGPVVSVRQPDSLRRAALDRQSRYRLLCQQARERFRVAEEFEASWRGHAIADQQFAAGEQWDDTARRSRQDVQNPRPCLTINQVPRFIRQITNDEQQNRPTIKVRPVDSVSDPETASAYDGLMRHIMYSSDFDVAEDTAFDHAVRIGRGYWRILIDYESAWSFEQVIRLERVLNPFEVYLDPYGRQHPDYRTANWAFVASRMPRSYLSQKYEVTTQDWAVWMAAAGTWVSQDEALVADYYYRDELPVQLVQLANREVRYIAQLPADEDLETDEERVEFGRLTEVIAWRMQRQGVYPLTEDVAGQIRQSRQSLLPVIYQCKFAGVALLEEPTVWPGQYIPIVPVLGDEMDLNGDLDYRGIVRDMTDAQRAFNYWVTMAAETVALAPKAPFIGAVQQFQNLEHYWQKANTSPMGYLPYNPVAPNGVPLPPPQRNAVEPPIQAIGFMIQQSTQNLYATSGIQPADLGEPSNEKSGRHAQIRKAESELSTSQYKVHLMWALRHTGRILIDLIPQVYHEPGRVLRILGKDQSESMMMIHPDAKGMQEDVRRGQAALPSGIENVYDLGVGVYDLVVDTGPNYLTQRQEAAANMIDVAQALPAAAQVIPDLIVGMQDWDGAEEAARRLRKTLPPGILDQADQQGAKPEEQVMQLASRLQQVQMEAQALDAHAQELQAALTQATQERVQLEQSQQVKVAELHLKGQEVALKEREVALQEREAEIKALAETEKARLERDKLVFEQEQAARALPPASSDFQHTLATIQTMLDEVLRLERAEQEGEGTQA